MTLEDEHLSDVAEIVLTSWPLTKTEVQKKIQPHWSFRNETAIIDGISIKGRRIIIPASLKDKAIKQLHINDMGIEKKNASK